MPVIDHDSSEQVKSTVGKLYGCKDIVYADGYLVKVRDYAPDGTYVMVDEYIPHTMSKECRFDRSLTDPRCAECGHKGKGEAYSAGVIANGA